MSTFSNKIESLPTEIQSLVLEELHRIASRFMRGEQQGHTLQATALVNEAYLKLANKTMHVVDKKHFTAIAAQQMRRILVDHAREKNAAKRGGNQVKVTLVDHHGDINALCGHNQLELIYIDELLNQLATFDSRASQIFELKLFSMLSHPDIAELLQLSLATIERDIQAAKAWFKVQLQAETLNSSVPEG
ncbi:MAG: ECF-type sigma factor [Paraglaciecola sp.]|uniref:ECF-type sigma factor n=1 Tax=Paraglaciecola sp. TaxID=1920173 RepID=UPI0032977711